VHIGIKGGAGSQYCRYYRRNLLHDPNSFSDAILTAEERFDASEHAAYRAGTIYQESGWIETAAGQSSRRIMDRATASTRRRFLDCPFA
jgi:hypothetical protein